MLIEFSISNYRSFREKQTFSMVAAPKLPRRDNVLKPALKEPKFPNLLKVAAIYGPNASGKSNLLRAFDIVRKVAKRQPSAQSIPLPVTPFRFDPQLADKPTQIELHFICAEQRYQFELALTQQRIVEECLTVFPRGKETLLYRRSHQPNGDIYSFGEELKGGKDLHDLWKKATGPQVLFLAQAVANSSEEMTQLRKPYEWFVDGIQIVFGNMGTWASGSQKIAMKFPSFAEDISSFLQEVDVPVSKIYFDQTEPEYLEQSFQDMIAAADDPKTILIHRTALGEAEFDFQDESEGTKNLIGFCVPWSMNYLSENRILIVDELDSSLHPEIVAALVEKHLKSNFPSQLIFTTHDTHLMDTKLLRRDQLWLTERDINGATQLRSIHDFDGRESEDIEKRYFEGRYRGLPLIRKG